MWVDLSDLRRRPEERREQNESLQTGISLLDELPGLQFGAVTVFYGPPASAKTSLLSRIALTLTETDIQVLYVPQEEGNRQFLQRIKKHVPEEKGRGLFLPNDDGIDSYSDVIQLCRDELDSARRAVVILDSIQSFKVADGNDNHSDRFYREIGDLVRYATEKGIALFLISEETRVKGGRHPKGTSALRYKPSVIVHLSRKDDVLTLKIEKDRNGPRAGMASSLRFDPIALTFTETTDLEEEVKVRRPKRRRRGSETRLKEEAERLQLAMKESPEATNKALREITGLKRTRFETVLKIVNVSGAGRPGKPGREGSPERIQPTENASDLT